MPKQGAIFRNNWKDTCSIMAAFMESPRRHGQKASSGSSCSKDYDILADNRAQPTCTIRPHVLPAKAPICLSRLVSNAEIAIEILDFSPIPTNCDLLLFRPWVEFDDLYLPSAREILSNRSKPTHFPPSSRHPASKSSTRFEASSRYRFSSLAVSTSACFRSVCTGDDFLS